MADPPNARWRRNQVHVTMPQLVEQKVRIGFDAYGRMVEATRFVDPAGKRMWRIESHPMSQQDDGERMSGLTDDNLRDLVQALDHVRKA